MPKLGNSRQRSQKATTAVPEEKQDIPESGETKGRKKGAGPRKESKKGAKSLGPQSQQQQNESVEMDSSQMSLDEKKSATSQKQTAK